jgi:hypothetical protein
MMKLADIDQVQVEKIIVNFHGLTPFCLKNWLVGWGRYRMVVGFTTTHAISAYRH